MQTELYTPKQNFVRPSSALQGIKSFRKHNPTATWADFKAAQAIASKQHKASASALNRNIAMNHDYIVGGAS